METQLLPRTPYPTDVSDEEWVVVAPYLTLMTEAAPQRRHDLREVCNALRWIVRAGAARFRRLAKDDQRLPETVAGLHFVAFACLMLHRLLTLAAQSP
jgi:hypothetical protein